MLKDSRSYEVQIIDAVRSVNRALGGTYGTSSAIYKNEFNQYEVQLIDAIKGIGRTLSGKGVSISGGIGGDSSEALQDLARRVTKLENESFFRLVDGNVTLKEQYSNLWVPGWLAAGGVGSGGGGGGSSFLRTLEDVHHSGTGVLRVDGTAVVPGDALVYNSTFGWVAAPVSGGGGSGTVTGVRLNGTTHTPSGTGIVDLGNETDPTVPAWAKQANPALYIGYSAVQTTAQEQNLFGIPYINATNSASSKSRMIWDSTNEAWHFYGNVYADGWIAAGGVGSGGGGGASSLSSLSDVSLSSPSNGQALVYRSGVWQNETIQAGTTVSWGSSGSDYQYLSVNGTSKKLLTEHQDLSGYVTLATTQTITGAKTFTISPVTIGQTSSLSVHESSHIDFGPIRIEYDSASKALHITRADSSDTNLYSLYADGFLAAGGAGQTI